MGRSVSPLHPSPERPGWNRCPQVTNFGTSALAADNLRPSPKSLVAHDNQLAAGIAGTFRLACEMHGAPRDLRALEGGRAGHACTNARSRARGCPLRRRAGEVRRRHRAGHAKRRRRPHEQHATGRGEGRGAPPGSTQARCWLVGPIGRRDGCAARGRGTCPPVCDGAARMRRRLCVGAVPSHTSHTQRGARNRGGRDACVLDGFAFRYEGGHRRRPTNNDFSPAVHAVSSIRRAVGHRSRFRERLLVVLGWAVVEDPPQRRCADDTCSSR